ncbi:speckle-type POZ protein-like [Thrips palmi]|uniref:Speckle-type POZ protein-like n=1 Tax=Thrips palmi TaxID=161013 RepID=A0A6P9A288_THRPL|nr:speckle-type POZ protein-like [Thrips palmi]XP_034251393.1 speckle-type POZ protein-like [Thrips palmi]XP_034251394.1 speckle-type POZ protein-like [Thrips palmi]
MAFDQGQITTSDFTLSCADALSSLEMKRTLTSSDNHVKWEVTLSMSPDPAVTGQYELNLEAAAMTTDENDPPQKKFVHATCQLVSKTMCSNCRRSYGYATCAYCPAGLLVTGPLRNSFYFSLRSVKVPASCIQQVANGRSQMRCLPVTVNLCHFKTVEEVPKLSADGSHVVESLKALLDSGELSDVTFVVGGEEIKAHSQILGACSDVFKAMFQHDTLDRRTGRVTVADDIPEAFKEMLRCVYTDSKPAWTKGEHADTFLMGLLFLAEKYNLGTLRGQCQRRILYTMSVGNVVGRLKALDVVCPDMVPLVADPFVRTHLSEILASASWAAFMKESVSLAADVMYLAMKR